MKKIILIFAIAFLVASCTNLFTEDTVGTYAEKAIVSSENLQTIGIAIGDWNMDTLSWKAVAHGLDWTKIRSVDAVIIDDNDSLRRKLMMASTVFGSIDGWDTTSIYLSRTQNGFYDNANFNATGFNRGWIVITYVI
jgi:hypothetical protein